VEGGRMIQVENLSKKFANVQAVKDISFKVEKGKIWGFLGPNGAGKTTTMRILTGYLPPNQGQAKINGIDVSTNSKSIKRMVGYLPEVVPVYGELTVREYLRFVAELYSIEKKKINFAIDRVIEKTNLQDVYKRLIKNISRGFRQRLGIAQAIIHEPSVLILDEPTSGLDPAQIIEIREMIRSFKDSSTVILSSHILAEITQVCDGAVIIKEGRLMATLTREEWGKNLEIATMDMAPDTNWNDFKNIFPYIDEVKAEGHVLKLEFRETLSDYNPIIQYLIQKDIKIKEIKSGLEALYMKIILSEEGRVA
jgi:ABC-2 type transport system ATP-binding protein